MENTNVYIETYGCQMNFSDTEIVSSVLVNNGYSMIDNPENADVIFLNTCSIRDNAEKKIYERLMHLKQYKKKNKKLVVGVLGCMAERLRGRLLDEREIVGIVAGPDEYRKVPDLIETALHGTRGIAVQLSRVETYDDIPPLRTEGIAAWVSIMRGCDNFCTYCVVPYTRGRERSRPAKSIVKEAIGLAEHGFKEITLLGQNVNSFYDEETKENFSALLKSVAEAVPEMRIRFMTSHPKDISDELIETIASHKNICNFVHLPVQSGSNRVLDKMSRSYTVEHYLERIAKIKEIIPGVSLSTDIIAGFPSETLEEHQMTMELMAKVQYDGAFMFKYSPRENTKAFKMEDDVPEDEKLRRLNEIIQQQLNISKELNIKEIGNIHEVLVEGESKKKKEEWQGRSDSNKVVVFPKADTTKIGDLVKVRITKSTSGTLYGELI
jgi:tRNA-2-methylthio-N6-dimethylallyladenosine synthase